MNFELDADQLALQDAVGRLLADTYAFEQRGRQLQRPLGSESALWGQLADLGLMGLLVPEDHNGAGKSLEDVLVVQEQFGKYLVADAFWMSAVAGVTCLNLAADDDQKRRFFPRVVAGALPLAVVSPMLQGGSRTRPEVTAVASEIGWVINGAAGQTIGADEQAALVIHAAAANGDELLLLLEPGSHGVVFDRFKCHDGSRGAKVVFRGAVVDNANRLDTGAVDRALRAARDNAIAALCSEAVGAMAAALELTLDYIRTRKQFGKSLSSFQVLQHRGVDMLIAVERARSMSLLAAVSIDRASDARRSCDAAAAKVQICQSARFVGQQAIQLHGGMGMTDEYPIGHYFKRLTALELLLGTEDLHVGALVRAGGMFADPEAER